MQDKQKNEKPFVLKKSSRTASELAQIVGCSESLVKKVRTGDKQSKTPLVEAIKIADHLLYEGENQLIIAVKKLVKL